MAIRMKNSGQSVSDLMPAALKSAGVEYPSVTKAKKSVAEKRVAEKAPLQDQRADEFFSKPKKAKGGETKPCPIRLPVDVIEAFKKNTDKHTAAMGAVLHEYALAKGWL